LHQAGLRVLGPLKNKLLAGLNPEQRKAVTTTEGPLLVLAGAGTGKTSVITRRIAYMIANGVPATSILAMTFTNKAAQEMKARIGSLVSKRSSAALTVGTFHSFCVKALRKNAEQAGIRMNFAICDAGDQLVAMKNALRELGIPETAVQPKAFLARVSLLKNRLTGPEPLLKSDDDWEANLGRAYQRYDQGLRASGLLDFDDLLLYMLKLLQDKKTCAWFQNRYQHLFIDEYQDTNGPQYEIVRLIGETHSNVCVVGDDDQSIYGWRGADVSKILNFTKDFPGAAVVRLETNYRSTNEILEAANAVIRNNPSRHEKALRSAFGPGEAIAIVKIGDEESEAAFVVDQIVNRIEEDKARLADFAILFRTQVQPRLFEMQLRQRHIPYTLVGGMSFFDRKEVRDILAYLKLVANPNDEISLLRVINVPARGIGLKTMERALTVAATERLTLTEVLARGSEFHGLAAASIVSANRFLGALRKLERFTSGSDLVELIKRLVVDVDYMTEIRRCYPDEESRTARVAAVTEIMNMAEIHGRSRRSATLATFLEDLTLGAAEETERETENNGDKIMLMTLHAAKGLEFEQVYLVGAEEGLLPHQRSIDDGDVEEERRLAYVGITRAKRRLTLTYTRSRARYGQRVSSMPSRFLYEMRGQDVPDDVLEAPPKPEAPKPAPAKRKRTKKKTARRRTRRKTAAQAQE
jgi:DNA helicase-2/ATP-dependent DNA helicase PcrA